LLEGSPGTGKTTIALQFLLAGAAAETTLRARKFLSTARLMLWISTY